MNFHTMERRICAMGTKFKYFTEKCNFTNIHLAFLERTLYNNPIIMAFLKKRVIEWQLILAEREKN